MLNTLSKKTLLLMIAVGISAGTSVAYAQTADKSGYVVDARNEVAKNPYGLCWRTGYWTPAMAIAECDPDLVKTAEKSTPLTTTPVTGTPSTPTTPDKKPETPTKNEVKLSADALFDFDKATLRAEGKQVLDDISVQAKGLNLDVIVVTGHTDRIGKEAYNLRLSERRAQAVKQYLVGKGIAADRIYAEGKGKTQPVTGDECQKMGKENRHNKKLIECLQPDRRVDVEMIGTK